MNRRVVLDAGPAFALLAWSVIVGGPEPAWPVLVMLTLPLAGRHLWPTATAAALAVGVIAATVYPVSASAVLPGIIAVLVAAFSVALYARWPWVGLIVLAAPLTAVVTQRFEFPLPGWTLPFAMVGSAWLAGLAIRRRSQIAEAWRDRAEHVRREQEALRAAALAEERSRIARELHDVVTHRVSVMVIQGGAARSVLASDPAAATEQLLALESGGREALTELRGLLDLLASSAADDVRVTTAPVPGLAGVPTLVDQARAAGLPIRYRMTGDPKELPTRIDGTAYRIVQEALTNSLRHSNHAGTSLSIHYGQSELVLDVVDDERGAVPPAATGRGLMGMRERAALLDGSIEVGLRPGKGFGVAVRLPLPEDPR